MCNCKNNTLNSIRRIARIQSKLDKQDIQIYVRTVGNKQMYNFEPINPNRENIIEIIKWVKE